mmetsp:Transcript_116498/g.340851  ORF Transcript_116498/g.340851 Transcript_116498/m.340851 type:complete len:232 (-) Transcript_116498:1193-1888(-)
MEEELCRELYQPLFARLGGVPRQLGACRLEHPIDRAHEERAVQLLGNHLHLIGRQDDPARCRQLHAGGQGHGLPAATGHEGEGRALAGPVRTRDRVHARRGQHEVRDLHAQGGPPREFDAVKLQGPAGLVGLAPHALARPGLGQASGQLPQSRDVGLHGGQLGLVARSRQQRVDRVLHHARVHPDVNVGDVPQLQEEPERALDAGLHHVLPIEPVDERADRLQRVSPQLQI